MSATLALTGLVMGLAGGVHCAAMCGAACAGVVRLSSGPAVLQPVGSVAGRAVAARSAASATLSLQAGRLLGYSAAGALAATAMQSLAWMTTQAVALRPVWTMLHAGLLAWGLMLLVLARQPVWVDNAGRALWALMPCGLLYSALLVAALSGGAAQGALTMALFAAGSAISIVAAPWLLLKVHARANHWRQDWGTRLAGLVLAGAAGWALWMDLMGRVGEICR